MNTLHKKDIEYTLPQKPIEEAVTVKLGSFASLDELQDLTYFVVYSDKVRRIEYEFTREELEKELMEEMNFPKDKVDLILSYLMNFREIQLDVATKRLIPVKRRYDLRLMS